MNYTTKRFRRGPRSETGLVWVVIFALLGIAAGLWVGSSHAATPQAVQMCTVTPAPSGGLMGCPNADVVMAVPKGPTDRLRAQVNGHQQWLPYSAVTATTILYGGTPAQWQPPAALGLALLPATPPTPPAPPPAATCPDTVVALNYTCSIANKTMTCTAPIP